MADTPAVAQGAKLMAEGENALLVVQKRLSGLPAVFAKVPELGAQERQAFSAEARMLAGEAAALELAVITYHQRLTERAKELGIDLPPPVKPGTMQPMGGGR